MLKFHIKFGGRATTSDPGFRGSVGGVVLEVSRAKAPLLFIDWQLFLALVATSETKQNVKQAVIEAKRVADQLQVMAGQLDRLADQILRQARKQFLM